MKAELLPLTHQLTGEENRGCSSVSATKTDLTDILVCVRGFQEDFSLTVHTKHCIHFIESVSFTVSGVRPLGGTTEPFKS